MLQVRMIYIPFSANPTFALPHIAFKTGLYVVDT